MDNDALFDVSLQGAGLTRWREQWETLGDMLHTFEDWHRSAKVDVCQLHADTVADIARVLEFLAANKATKFVANVPFTEVA